MNDVTRIRSTVMMHPLASHTMPNMLPSLLYMLFMWSAVPLIVSAMLGARIGLPPFPWRRIAGAFLGLTAGTISLAPTALASLWLAAQLEIPPMLPRFIVSLTGGCFLSSCLCYWVAKRWRPKKPLPTMDRLEATYAELESILIERRRGAVSTGHELDSLDLSSSKILSANQEVCLARIRTERRKFHRSNTVVHEDLASWIEETEDLISQLNRVTH